MNAWEKKTVGKIAKAFEQLPDDKREFLLGYAEGVAAMAEGTAKEEAEGAMRMPDKERRE